MRYLFALVVPPLAVLSCGRIVAAVFNLILFALAWIFFLAAVGSLAIPFGFVTAFFIVPFAILFWLISAVHALLVVAGYNAECRYRELHMTTQRFERPL